MRECSQMNIHIIWGYISFLIKVKLYSALNRYEGPIAAYCAA